MCPVAVGDKKLKSQHNRWCNAGFVAPGSWQYRTGVDSDFKALVTTLVGRLISLSVSLFPERVAGK